MGENSRMKTTPTDPDYRGYRFPPEIISHAVWLYFRFSLSFRDVEELLAQCRIAQRLYPSLEKKKASASTGDVAKKD